MSEVKSSSDSVVSNSDKKGAIEDAELVHEAFAKIAKRYVLTNHIVSAGTDILWRKRLAKLVKNESPKRLLDVATGTGDVAIEIAKQIPDCEIVGSDFCDPMLDVAREKGVKELYLADALDLPFDDESFDVVTVAFGLRNMASWDGALKEMNRVIKKNGSLFVLDFSIPDNFLKGCYCWYLQKVLPKVAGVITGQRDAFEYLAESIHAFPSGEKMNRFILENGFQSSKDIALTSCIASIYHAKK